MSALTQDHLKSGNRRIYIYIQRNVFDILISVYKNLILGYFCSYSLQGNGYIQLERAFYYLFKVKICNNNGVRHTTVSCGSACS